MKPVYFTVAMLLLWALTVPPVHADSIVFVTSASSSATDPSTTATATATIANGDLLIVETSGNGINHVTSVTDGGDTFTLQDNATDLSANSNLDQWTATTILSGSTTFTVNWGGTNFHIPHFTLLVYRNAYVTTNTFTGNGGQKNGVFSIATSTTHTGNWLVGAVEDDWVNGASCANATPTPQNGQTQEKSYCIQSASPIVAGAAQDIQPSTAGAFTFSESYNQPGMLSADWVIVVMEITTDPPTGPSQPGVGGSSSGSPLWYTNLLLDFTVLGVFITAGVALVTVRRHKGAN